MNGVDVMVCLGMKLVAFVVLDDYNDIQQKMSLNDGINVRLLEY